MDSILASNIKLDSLAILHEFTDINELEFGTFANQLSGLQEREFFRELHLYFDENQKEYIYPQHLLSKVNIFYNTNKMHSFALAPLVSLEQLFILNKAQISDVDVALGQLDKLNDIYFAEDSMDNILPFIQRLPKLRNLSLNCTKNVAQFNGDKRTLNLTALNEERKKLTKATKLTIYLQEKIYFATKKSFKWIKLEFIEIKRMEAYQGFNDFTVVDASTTWKYPREHIEQFNLFRFRRFHIDFLFGRNICICVRIS